MLWRRCQNLTYLTILRRDGQIDCSRVTWGTHLAFVVLDLISILLLLLIGLALESRVDWLEANWTLFRLCVRILGKVCDGFGLFRFIWELIDDLLHWSRFLHPSIFVNVHALNQSSWSRTDHLLRRNVSPAIINLLQVGQQHLHRDFHIFGLIWGLFEISNEPGIGFLELIFEFRVHLLLQKLRGTFLFRCILLGNHSLIMINALF